METLPFFFLAGFIPFIVFLVSLSNKRQKVWSAEEQRFTVVPWGDAFLKAFIVAFVAFMIEGMIAFALFCVVGGWVATHPDIPTNHNTAPTTSASHKTPLTSTALATMQEAAIQKCVGEQRTSQKIKYCTCGSEIFIKNVKAKNYTYMEEMEGHIDELMLTDIQAKACMQKASKVN